MGSREERVKGGPLIPDLGKRRWNPCVPSPHGDTQVWLTATASSLRPSISGGIPASPLCSGAACPVSTSAHAAGAAVKAADGKEGRSSYSGAAVPVLLGETSRAPAHWLWNERRGWPVWPLWVLFSERLSCPLFFVARQGGC